MKSKLVVSLLLAAGSILGQEPRHSAVEQRGDHVMGFSHEKTTHHFLLSSDGGAIQVTANDPKDTESVARIRMHLSHIAKMFADSNFQAPMLIHDRVPPGVAVLQKLKGEITYRFEEVDRGARVGISTRNAEALPAVHDFLRFQISDHQTGDSTEIPKAR